MCKKDVPSEGDWRVLPLLIWKTLKGQEKRGKKERLGNVVPRRTFLVKNAGTRSLGVVVFCGRRAERCCGCSGLHGRGESPACRVIDDGILGCFRGPISCSLFRGGGTREEVWFGFTTAARVWLAFDNIWVVCALKSHSNSTDLLRICVKKNARFCQFPLGICF